MKQRMVAICAVALAIVLWSLPAAADKPFDETALTGTYAFTTIQVREGEPPAEPKIVQCSGYGTITFFGDGTASMQGFERCAGDLEAKPYSGDMTYTTGPAPFFSIDEGPYSTHCQLLQRGEVMMCDGTQREPEMLAFHAVGFKQ
jgi:hypothetical protein